MTHLEGNVLLQSALMTLLYGPPVRIRLCGAVALAACGLSAAATRALEGTVELVEWGH